MGSAAIFDLDRTLLAGASGPVFARTLREVGLLPDRDIPGAGLLFRAFDLFGENLPSMLLTRQGARAARGWSVADAREAGRRAAPELAARVLPWARVEIDEHRAAGRRLVIATTTPEHLVEPLAAELGFDDVVATRYASLDGRFTGTIDGHFVWGEGKLAAVREWAAGAGVDLADSWAYSDSFYDVPLLSAVGHPVAVNPDARLAAVATARRWPVRWFDAPPGVPKILGRELQDLGRPLARPELIPYARFDIAGVEKIPAEGPAIVAFNHRSYFDGPVVGMVLASTGRKIRFLGKKEVFDAPVVGWLAHAAGGIRVERGTGSDEPLRRALKALAAGELIAIAPQGTIPRGPAFFEPELKGRWGTARLAAASGAPVYPMGLWGTERVWPRSSRVPHVWNVTNPPLVRVRIGDPVELTGEDPDTDTRRIMAAIVDLLPPEARIRREPTPEELARTFPPGYKGDPSREHERRPGTD